MRAALPPLLRMSSWHDGRPYILVTKGLLKMLYVFGASYFCVWLFVTIFVWK